MALIRHHRLSPGGAYCRASGAALSKASVPRISAGNSKLRQIQQQTHRNPLSLRDCALSSGCSSKRRASLSRTKALEKPCAKVGYQESVETETWKEIEVGLSINDAIEATGGLTKVQAALLGIQWAVMGALCLSCVFTRDSISGASAVAGGLSLAALGHGETAQLFGIMISAICSGWHSNTYGRRQAVLLSSGLLAAGGVLSTLASTDPIFIAGRFLVGLATGGLLLSTHCLACETASADTQQYLMGLLSLMWCVGGCALIPLSLALPGDWRLMGGILSVAGAALFAAMSTALPESPRWLLSTQKDVEGAAKVLSRLARRNGQGSVRTNRASSLARGLKIGIANDRMASAKAAAKKEGNEGAAASASDGGIFGKKFLVQSLSLFAASVGVAAIYWALSLGCHSLEGSIHVNAALNWGAELPPAMVVGHLMGSALGRRGTTVLAFVGAGAACAIVLAAPAAGGVATAVSKLLLLPAYSSVYTVAAEMYPTALRAGGIALARLGDGVGSFAAAAMLGCSSPFVFLTFTALLAGIVSMGLPETKGLAIQ